MAIDDTEDPDRALAKAAVDDPCAFEALYQRYVARVYRYAFARVRNAADADDLTSQTFLAALIGIDRYRGTGSFAAWLFGIASHLSVNHFRKAKEQVPLDESLALPGSAEALDDLVHERLQLARSLEAMSRLPADRAEALRLRIFGELSCAEVALLMGRSTAAAKMLIHRAVGDLRDALNAGASAAGQED